MPFFRCEWDNQLKTQHVLQSSVFGISHNVFLVEAFCSVRLRKITHSLRDYHMAHNRQHTNELKKKKKISIELKWNEICLPSYVAYDVRRNINNFKIENKWKKRWISKKKIFQSMPAKCATLRCSMFEASKRQQNMGHRCIHTSNIDMNWVRRRGGFQLNLFLNRILLFSNRICQCRWNAVVLLHSSLYIAALRNNQKTHSILYSISIQKHWAAEPDRAGIFCTLHSLP